jgi:ATPase subunit of ABC transporter with duplicated ATPase domains
MRTHLPWAEWLKRVPARESVDLLSGGERMRLRLLECLADICEIEEDGTNVVLIMDEPTNDLDRAGRTLVRDWVRAREDGLLIISHDRELLKEVDEVYELSSAGLRLYGGGVDFYFTQSGEEREREAQALEEAKRLLDQKSQGAQAKRERQEKRMSAGKKKAARGGIPRIILGGKKRQAQETLNRVELREEARVQRAKEQVAMAFQNQRVNPFLRLDFAAEARPASQILLRLEGLQIFTDQDCPLWGEPQTFHGRARDRIWLKGPSGAGKSTLLSLIRTGEVPCGLFKEGEIWRAALLDESGRVGFLDQKQSILEASKTVLEMVTANGRWQGQESGARGVLGV